MVVLVQEISISLLPILDSMNNNNSINNTNSNITPKVITISNINKKLETLFYFSIPIYRTKNRIKKRNCGGIKSGDDIKSTQ